MEFYEFQDAFENAETLFRNAFSLSDPLPELLSLMNAHPTQVAAIDLLVYYIEAVEANPSRANALASMLLTLRESPNAPTLEYDSTLAEVFYFKLADMHAQGLNFDEDGKTFGPTNTYLIHCLLSGLSFKYGLASCSDQYASIVDGLDACPDKSSTSELLVIGACIQLLTSGSSIIPAVTSYIQSANEVVTKLEFQKNFGAVKHANALKLLDLTISHAKCGFMAENDVNDVWNLLFPGPAG